jgi:propionate CoA-transferase
MIREPVSLCGRRVSADVWVLARVARTVLTSLWHDTRYPSPVPENARFMSPRAAVDLIGDGDVVAVSGLGGNQRASIMFWAIRETFEETGHPAGLTVMNLGGHGGRGRAPGTLEELGRRGLCRRLVTGHFETFRAMLDLAAAGDCELACIPQGTLALLIDALGRGEDSLLSPTGIGTFVDPRIGPGSRVVGRGAQLITAEGDRLRYRIPPIDVAVFNAPAADRHGNIYVRHCAMIGETAEIARAAKQNHGCVIANVGLIVDEGYDRVFLPADMVDAVVYHPDTEQAAGIAHGSCWPALTTESDVPIGEALERVRTINRLAGLTRHDTAVDDAVARLAAATLAAEVERGAHVNIGTGLPEHVCDVLFAAGLHDELTLLVESGTVGGLPASGIYFGAALAPKRIVSSADMWKLCATRLDATCLGALEADSDGNVNVSRRSDDVRDYVGPGGFIDLTAAARTIVFVSGWMVHGGWRVEDGTVRLVTRGAPKFVERVREITFNGPRALAAGKRVFYATPVGLFQLTERGMELLRIMPGIDVRRDILEVASMRIVLPATGEPALLPRAVVSGEGFTLRTASEPAPAQRMTAAAIAK